MAKPRNALASSFIPEPEPDPPEVVSTPLRIAPKPKKKAEVKKLTVILSPEKWLAWKMFAAKNDGQSLQGLIETTVDEHIRRRSAKRAD